jgi:hypothetical protein
MTVVRAKVLDSYTNLSIVAAELNMPEALSMFSLRQTWIGPRY